MMESMKFLASSLIAGISLLTDRSRERIEELGGVGDWGK